MPVHVLRAPAGSGKTRAYISRIANRPNTQTFEIYSPTIELAEEIKAKLDAYGTGHKVAVIKGRHQKDSAGVTLCHRDKLVDKISQKGIAIFPTMCLQRTQYGVQKCPNFGDCGYIRQFQQCNIRIYTHAYLMLDRTMLDDKMPDVVIIDEDFTLKLVEAVEVPFALLSHVSTISRFSDALGAINTWLCTQDHTALLQDYQRLVGSQGSWSNLAKDLQQVRPSISPGASDSLVASQVINHKDVRPVAHLLSHLDRVLSRGLAPNAIDIKKNMVVVHHRHSIRRFGDMDAPDAPKIFITDATISEMVLRQCMPVDRFEAVSTPRNAVVYQCSDSLCSTRSLVSKNQPTQEGQQRAVARLSDVQKLVDQVAATGLPILVVGPSAITGNSARGAPALLTGATNVRFAHFGAVRGIDSFKDCEVVVLIGRNEPSPEALENIARALFYDDPTPIQQTGVWQDTLVGYTMASRNPIGVIIPGHADPRVHEVLMQVREAESIQALDRLRMIHNVEPKLVIVLSKIPLPGLVVNELMTWRQLTQSDAMLKLYVHHDFVLPLNAAWMAGQTGQTVAAAKKALQRWANRGHPLQKFSKWKMSPLTPTRLGQYRLPGQRTWSRFLHGYASPAAAQSALEAVLGTSVQVK